MAIQNEATEPNAEVIAVYPNRIKISVDDLSKFSTVDSQLEKLRVGSYLEVSDDDNHKLIVIIESYSIEYKEDKVIDDEDGEKILKNKRYIIEANPLGTLVNDKFQRGGDSLTIPPTKVRPASADDIKKIYQSEVTENEKFSFATLLTNKEIEVPVNGNKFFNKHFAIVGSTGSGKSHTVAKVLQEAVNSKNGGYDGLNNSHIVIFDIHGEYKTAFPDSNYITADNLTLPYWLLDAQELEELFLDSGDRNNYNQTSILRRTIIENKKKYTTSKEIHFGTPTKFDIQEVFNCLYNFQHEAIDYNDNLLVKQKDNDIQCSSIEDKYLEFYKEKYDFEPAVRSKIKSGIYADGTLDKFIDRFENKINNSRLNFLFGEKSRDISFTEVLSQFIGYPSDFNKNKSNITIIDLGGIPFEVLSIVVSLISRMLFEFGYYSKKKLNEGIDCETPILLLYEEAHKYVPKSDLVKYRSSKTAIERIAKEGRKYGVTLGIVSQRPSEVSETIFSQCNTFIAMRLTNPDDQNYVKKLLPDTMGNMTEMLPSLKAGDALLVGESIAIPSLVHLNECSPSPKSSDIKYIEVWKEKWKDVDFDDIIKEWKK